MEPPTEPKGATISLKLPCILSQQLSQPPLKLPQPNMPKIEVFTLSPLFRADSTRTPMDSTYPECQFFGSGAAGIFR